eukprot:scaffold7714_cov130-Skeletonema_dohrnii-CCMP3373.AAC.1
MTTKATKATKQRRHGTHRSKRPHSIEQPRTGWVSQLASRQNMLWADSYARIVSAARVKKRAKSFS